MPDTLIGTQQSDNVFQLRVDPSGIGTRVSDPWRASLDSPQISGSSVVRWIGLRHCTTCASMQAGTIFLRSEEAEFLSQLRKDLDELPASLRISPEAESFRHFIEGVGLTLARIPRVRCAVFGDDEDGITLTAHSRASMRQVSFEFAPAANSIKIVSIDEQMQLFERSCSIEKSKTLAEAIAWLIPR